MVTMELNITDRNLGLLKTQNDRCFFDRVHKTPSSIYISRLEAISFSGMNKICDAGCGYGQWSFPLSKLNKSVHGIDSSADRISVCQALLVDNPSIEGTLEFLVEDIQKTNFPDQYFDGVFSYSVLYLTDYRKTLKELHRILKPGGKLYFSSNDIGWYCHNLVDRPNAASDYDPREMALKAISDTCLYYSTGEHVTGSSIIMPIHLVLKELEKMGLEVISYGADGEINLTKTSKPKAFFQKEYHGHLGPYEILAEKKFE